MRIRGLRHMHMMHKSMTFDQAYLHNQAELATSSQGTVLKSHIGGDRVNIEKFMIFCNKFSIITFQNLLKQFMIICGNLRELNAGHQNWVMRH